MHHYCLFIYLFIIVISIYYCSYYHLSLLYIIKYGYKLLETRNSQTGNSQLARYPACVQGVFLKSPVLLNLQKPMCEGHVQLISLLKTLVLMKKLLVVLQSLVPGFEYASSTLGMCKVPSIK